MRGGKMIRVEVLADSAGPALRLTGAAGCSFEPLTAPERSPGLEVYGISTAPRRRPWWWPFGPREWWEVSLVLRPPAAETRVERTLQAAGRRPAAVPPGPTGFPRVFVPPAGPPDEDGAAEGGGA